jgi:hypothetical protein
VVVVVVLKISTMVEMVVQVVVVQHMYKQQPELVLQVKEMLVVLDKPVDLEPVVVEAQVLPVQMVLVVAVEMVVMVYQ